METTAKMLTDNIHLTRPFERSNFVRPDGLPLNRKKEEMIPADPTRDDNSDMEIPEADDLSNRILWLHSPYLAFYA
jgi:hypothetical protein